MQQIEGHCPELVADGVFGRAEMKREDEGKVMMEVGGREPH